MKRISDRDIALEPRLAGMEDNAVFQFLCRRPGRKSVRGLLVATLVPMFALAICALYAYSVGAMFLMQLSILGMQIPGIVLTVRAALERGRGPGGGPPFWADLADAAHPPEDAARGLWAARLPPDSSPLGAGAFVAVLAAAVFLLPAGSPRSVGVFVATIVAGSVAFGYARRRDNPWMAIRDARMHGRAFSGGALSELVPANRWEVGIAWDAQEERTMGCLGLGCGGPLLFLLSLALLADGRGAPLLRFLVVWLPWFGPLGAAITGWIVGRLQARGDRRGKEREFALLVMNVRWRMNDARLRLHGPDAVVVEAWTDPSASSGSS